jgi:hypothetical protein
MSGYGNYKFFHCQLYYTLSESAAFSPVDRVIEFTRKIPAIPTLKSCGNPLRAGEIFFAKISTFCYRGMKNKQFITGYRDAGEGFLFFLPDDTFPTECCFETGMQKLRQRA